MSAKMVSAIPIVMPLFVASVVLQTSASVLKKQHVEISSIVKESLDVKFNTTESCPHTASLNGCSVCEACLENELETGWDGQLFTYVGCGNENEPRCDHGDWCKAVIVNRVYACGATGGLTHGQVDACVKEVMCHANHTQSCVAPSPHPWRDQNCPATFAQIASKRSILDKRLQQKDAIAGELPQEDTSQFHTIDKATLGKCTS
jgi:hypothetical protein